MDEQLRRDLERLGERFDFGAYESEAYLTVLRHGQLTAAEIADRTEIPQPRVYDTVRTLADEGLVELRESRPMQVLAVDPSEAFDEIRSSLDAVIEGLSTAYTTPAPDDEAVTLVTARGTILRYLEELITDAEYELVLSLTPDLLARFEETLAERRAAGVSTELVLAPAADVPPADQYDYERVATAVRARRGVTTPVVGVADGSSAVYTTTLQEDSDRYGVIFTRSELGFLVSGFLNTVVWSSARPVLANGTDGPFPRRYATMRRCVEDLGDTTGLYATVRGREVDSGRRRTVAGRLVERDAGDGRRTAAITLDADGERVEVGGQLAALEDVEAHEIVVGRDEPPEL